MLIAINRRRVAEMEQRLDGLVALLSSGNVDNHGKVLAPPAASHQPLSAKMQHETYIPSRVQIAPDFTHILPPLSSWGSYDLQDVIGKGIISFEEAESCLQTYRSNSPNFPFVLLHDRMTLDTLRREKPFLLLAVLAMASISNVQRQNKIEAELKESLSRRVIINGEKSLDLCQGLMVYLAW
jgi:hypothetical protein